MNRRSVLGGVAIVGGMAGMKRLDGLAGERYGDEDTETTTSGDGEIRTEASGRPDREAAETRIVELINAERQDRQTAELRRDRFLADPARQHSKDMHERDFYGHENPDGQQPWDRVDCNAAETLHRGELGRMENQGSDRTWQTRETEQLANYVFEGWQLSDRHYAILTDRDYERVGVGVYVGDTEFFATAMFC